MMQIQISFPENLKKQENEEWICIIISIFQHTLWAVRVTKFKVKNEK